MESAVSSLVNALTISMSTFTSAIGSGIVDIFKFVFLQVDSNGTIIGFNFLGYVAAIFFGFGLLMILVIFIIKKITYSYRISQLDSMDSDIKLELMEEWYQNYENEYKDSYRGLVYDYMDDLFKK